MIPTTTPFDPVTGEVDLVALRAQRRKMGSYRHSRPRDRRFPPARRLFLDEHERGLCWDVVARSVPDDMVLVAGTGAESLRTTLRLTRMAAGRGFHAALVQPPPSTRAP